MENSNVNSVYREELRKLEMIYDFINETFFDCNLPHVLITMEPDKARLGWFCSRSYWEYDGKKRISQINISPDYMNYSYIQICETILHEAVHVFLSLNGKETTVSNYHTLDFKAAAEENGLLCQKGKYGWSKTEPQPKTKQLFKDFLERNHFGERPNIFRTIPPKPEFITIELDPPIARYKCLDCEIIIHVPVQSQRDILPSISCPLCQKQMSVRKPRKKKDS